MIDSKIAPIPLEGNIRLTPSDGAPLCDTSLYHQLVENLVYLTVTGLDIAHAVHIVNQLMAAPQSIHYTAILRILRYVKGTLFHALHFSTQSFLHLHVFSDTN